MPTETFETNQASVLDRDTLNLAAAALKIKDYEEMDDETLVLEVLDIILGEEDQAPSSSYF